jgi:hypothetical protein
MMLCVNAQMFYPWKGILYRLKQDIRGAPF